MDLRHFVQIFWQGKNFDCCDGVLGGHWLWGCLIFCLTAPEKKREEIDCARFVVFAPLPYNRREEKINTQVNNNFFRTWEFFLKSSD